MKSLVTLYKFRNTGRTFCSQTAKTQRFVNLLKMIWNADWLLLQNNTDSLAPENLEQTVLSKLSEKARFLTTPVLVYRIIYSCQRVILALNNGLICIFSPADLRWSYIQNNSHSLALKLCRFHLVWLQVCPQFILFCWAFGAWGTACDQMPTSVSL